MHRRQWWWFVYTPLYFCFAAVRTGAQVDTIQFLTEKSRMQSHSNSKRKYDVIISNPYNTTLFSSFQARKNACSICSVGYLRGCLRDHVTVTHSFSDLHFLLNYSFVAAFSSHWAQFIRALSSPCHTGRQLHS